MRPNSPVRASGGGPHLIVPMWAKVRTRRITGSDLVRVNPLNPFRIVMMTLDSTREEAHFFAASDTPFCTTTMESLRRRHIDR